MVLFVSRNLCSAHLPPYTLLLYFSTFQLSNFFGVWGEDWPRKERAKVCTKSSPILVAKGGLSRGRLKSEELWDCTCIVVDKSVGHEPVLGFKSWLPLSGHLTWATDLTFLYCHVLLESGDNDNI